MTRTTAAERSMRGQSRTPAGGMKAPLFGAGAPAGSPMFLQGFAGRIQGLHADIHRTCAGCGPEDPCPDCMEKEWPRGIRPMLTVSQPGDEAERQADRLADQVLRMPVDPEPAGRSIDRRADPGVPALARHGASSGAAASPFAVPARESGRPLSASAREFFEPRVGRDLGDVRIHDDLAAADSARRLQARAYAYGSQIVFGAGQFAPDHDAGRRLLAHELAHVLQQSGNGVK